MITIGLNLIFILPEMTGGIQTYANGLIPALRSKAPDIHFIAFLNKKAGKAGLDFLDDKIRTVTLPVYPRNRLGWIPGEIRLLPKLAEQKGCDLVHSFASTGPFSGNFKRITTIHDLIYRILPEYHHGIRYLGPKLLVSKCLIPAAASGSHRIITGSHAAAGDIIRLLKLDPSKVDVVYHGPGTSKITKAADEYELRQRYTLGNRLILLCVSASWPHKNIPRLIKALSLLPLEERPILVVPGYTTHHKGYLMSLAEKSGVADDIRFLPWLSAEELEGFYETASCFVSPSLYEGFGLPALEAMTRGLPVACSRGGAIEEIVGDAALTFDPLHPKEMALAIRRLLTDRKDVERLRLLGKKRASFFSWEKAAQGTLKSYARALGTAYLS